MGDIPMVEKCENLMNIVVESRKRFGKMCVDYEHKTSLMDNKILHLELETISSYRFKSKLSVTDLQNEESTKEIDDFVQEMEKRQHRKDSLKETIKETHKVVAQIQNDSIGKKIHQPLNAETMLSLAKAKVAGK